MARHYSSEELFDVSIKWINLFDFTPTPIQNIYELSSGVTIFKLLCKLSPTYFNIKSINSSPHNQYSKNNNIIELKQCLEQFFNDVIDQDIAIDKMIDHNKITSNSSYSSNESNNIRTQHYIRLLEMILLCSIKCENKQITISKMTSLTMKDQGILMNILQTLMTNSGFEIKDSNNSNNSNNNSNNNENISEKANKITHLQTPTKTTSFNRLSMSNYTASNHKYHSPLSPFGSKKKSKFNAYNTHEFEGDKFNMQSEIKLKKDNLKLNETNINLNNEINTLRMTNKEIERKYIELKSEFNIKQNEFKNDLLNKCNKNEKDNKLEIDTLKQEVNKYKSENRYNNEEINEYKKALIQLQEENDKYKQELQDINDINDRKMRQLKDELDIAEHQSDKVYTFEKQIKTYKLRLETMNDIQTELNKYKKLFKQKCDMISDFEIKLKIIPNLKTQCEKYKKQMIEYKIASIGKNGLNDKQMINKIGNLEQLIQKLNEENDELNIKLKTARKEIIDLETKINTTNNNEYFMNNNNMNMNVNNNINSEIQSKISKLESENRRLQLLNNNKHTMNDLMDELDTKTRLLKETEIKYNEIELKLNIVNKELSNMKQTSAEWMRNSCSPQQYKNTLNQLKNLENSINNKNNSIDSLKDTIDKLKENKITNISKLKEYENELNRIKQRYRDLYEYTEKQKMRLDEYKNALNEMKSFESNQKNKSFETQKYFNENIQLKEKIKYIKQEMDCVQNACMNLLKRQVLINNNMLSKKKRNDNRENKSNSESPNNNNMLNMKTLNQQKQHRQNAFINRDNKTSQIQRPSTFSFRK